MISNAMRKEAFFSIATEVLKLFPANMGKGFSLPVPRENDCCPEEGQSVEQATRVPASRPAGPVIYARANSPPDWPTPVNSHLMNIHHV